MEKWTVSQSDERIRIDCFLNNKLPYSRNKINEMIKKGLIQCNGNQVKPNYRIKINDSITVSDYTPTHHALVGIPMPLDIIYEDSWLMVINKPVGCVVHPGKNTVEPTLLHGLIAYFDSLNCPNIKPGLVHRIDKDTCGLLVIAKDAITHAALASQLETKTMQRFYIALCHGIFKTQFQRVTLPIGVDPNNRKKMTVDMLNGRHATTEFVVLETAQDKTLVACSLETGRTHQIRVHAAALGHPLVGDPLYSSDRQGSGQRLCGYKLQFIHPHTNQLKTFEITIPTHFLTELTIQS